jgi:nitrogenase molybdenum-iron protein alpha/beta subunit
MNLKVSPTLLSRTGGCTLTGALSVTTQVRDAVSIIHGPKGCAHHNFSLFHATGLDNERVAVPDLVSSSLTESDIVFGGEEALSRTIRSVTGRDVAAVFVLSTCIVETIGDDVAAGFLGGNFQDGVNKALIALAGLAEPVPAGRTVNIIGEKNLEFEVEENYAEIVRLLTLLGLPGGLRFVHDITLNEISGLGSAQLNILRDPSLLPVGEYLKERFGTPYEASFPTGLSGTLAFIESVASSCGVEAERALDIERALQAEVLMDFADISDYQGVFSGPVTDPESSESAREAADALHIQVSKDPKAPPLPVHPVVGTSGIRRLLHRWRRSLHA